MVDNTRDPFSIFTGQQAQIRLISRSHGIIRPNLVDSFEFNPKFSTKEIPEFDNPVNALVYTTFDGGTGKISYTESNQGQITASLMDTDPTQPLQMLNPAGYAPFDAFLNFKGQDGRIKRSLLTYGATVSGNPLSQAVKEAGKRSIDFSALNGVIFDGLALQYTRVMGANTALTAPIAPTLNAGILGDFLGKTVYVRVTKTTALGETAGSQEVAITLPTTGAGAGVDVVCPSASSEASCTGYRIYVGNRSNGERLYGTLPAAGGTKSVISFPSPTAAKCPNVDTSGWASASGDKTWTAGGVGDNFHTVTLDVPAVPCPQTGLAYALVKRNGVIVATVDNPATTDTFLISADGTTITVNDAENGADDVWEFLTLYQP